MGCVWPDQSCRLRERFGLRPLSVRSCLGSSINGSCDTARDRRAHPGPPSYQSPGFVLRRPPKVRSQAAKYVVNGKVDCPLGASTGPSCAFSMRLRLKKLF
jgi:hypothetical protein